MPRSPRGKRTRTADGSFTVSGKAANGEGSLYREADGVWRATYRVPGESRPRRVWGRTREKALRRRADALSPTGLGTHGGRSTAITVLYAEEGLDLADIARHVGHATPTTTAGYVRHLGRRPTATAEAARRLLDPTDLASG